MSEEFGFHLDRLGSLARRGLTRGGWVVVGDVSMWLSAVAGLLALLRWGPTPAVLIAAPVACLVCQAVAVAAVVCPGLARGDGGGFLASRDPHGRPAAGDGHAEDADIVEVGDA